MKLNYFHYICAIKTKKMEDINRIKLVLVEKKRTSKWLSEQLGVTPSTVSKWCTNSSQPDLGNLLKIADLLEVDIKELLVREYKRNYLLPHEEKQEVPQAL
jgi:transcriptional regulator with XRE-family HTH domain